MAAIQNEIDKILQAAGTRILSVSLPTYVTIPWDGVTSKPPIVGDDVTISPSNYTTYMDAQSVSAMAYSQNSGSTSGSGTHVDTSMTFDSNGENVILHFVAQLSTASAATYGSSYMEIHLKQNGTLVYSSGILGAPNVTGILPYILTFTDFLYIASPGTGSNVFLVEVYYTNVGDGTDGQCFRPTLQIIGLKR